MNDLRIMTYVDPLSFLVTEIYVSSMYSVVLNASQRNVT